MATKAKSKDLKTATENEVPVSVRGWKGFNKDLCCSPNGKPFQYEVGKTYEFEGGIEWCREGFHFCTDPLSVLDFYPNNGENRYAEIVAEGTLDQTDYSSKRVCQKITIVREVTINDLTLAEIAAISLVAKEKSSGNSSTAASSGNSSTAASSGDYSKAASSGDSSTAASSGDYSKAECDTNGFACVAGIIGRVKGKDGSALSLGYKDSAGRMRIAVAYVGEGDIKPHTWYRCDDKGNFIAD